METPSPRLVSGRDHEEGALRPRRIEGAGIRVRIPTAEAGDFPVIRFDGSDRTPVLIRSSEFALRDSLFGMDSSTVPSGGHRPPMRGPLWVPAPGGGIAHR